MTITCLALAGCETGTGDIERASLPVAEYDEVAVNAYFYYDREVYLGRVKGASACGSAALLYATSQGLSFDDRWSYVCCTVRKGSQCHEQIK